MTRSRPSTWVMISLRDSRLQGCWLAAAKGASPPNSDRFRMIVDSGELDYLTGGELIPKLRNSMRDYKEMKEMMTIVAWGNENVFATATGTTWGYIVDQGGQRVHVRISAMFVPGLGSNLFSSVKAMRSEVSAILETGNPHMQFDSHILLPLNQHRD